MRKEKPHRNRAQVVRRKAALLLPLFCVALACKADIEISMTNSVPPAFTFERARSAHVYYLDFFVVRDIAPANQNRPHLEQDPDKNTVIWQVWPRTTADGTIDSLPPITYGSVPAGFNQTIPKEGTPPPLLEGKVYEAGGPPISMRKGYLRFVIRDGKAVAIPIPGRD